MVRDESGLIVAWFVRLLLGFVIFGVIAYDAGAILVNFFTLNSRAEEIALEVAADSLGRDSFFDQAPLQRTARDLARESDARLVSFEVKRDGTIELRIRRAADTLIVERVSAIEDWGRATADASVAPRN
jgi:hypothetical protein